MLSEDIAISVRNLSKTYRLFRHPGDRIKQFFSLGLKQYHQGFTALKDVSFDIKKGETVGIIGCNGSGKSTLLQLICGILKPTSGTVTVSGRISALLELGAGFNPEFTGRENVYFQGALMGFTQTQIKARFDEIATFADIDEFIDQPVRTYSSGMFVRLAFAVAIHADPDILVVDEALAVGDSAFQARSLERIDTIRKQGGTILIVTHALEQVAHHCDRGILLDRGQMVEYSETPRVLARYISLLNKPALPETRLDNQENLTFHADRFASHPGYNVEETRWGDRQAAITDIVITQRGIRNPETLISGVPIEISFRVEFLASIERPIYGMAIKSENGAILFSTNSRLLLTPLHAGRQSAGNVVNPKFTLTPIFRDGVYLLSLGVASEEGSGVVPHDRRYDSLILRISTPDPREGNVDMCPIFELGEPA